MAYWRFREFIRGGIRLHVVEANDPLELGALKIDTGEWVLPGEEIDYDIPQKGDKVLVVEMLKDNKLYWYRFHDKCIDTL